MGKNEDLFQAIRKQVEDVVGPPPAATSPMDRLYRFGEDIRAVMRRVEVAEVVLRKIGQLVGYDPDVDKTEADLVRELKERAERFERAARAGAVAFRALREIADADAPGGYATTSIGRVRDAFKTYADVFAGIDAEPRPSRGLAPCSRFVDDTVGTGCATCGYGREMHPRDTAAEPSRG